MTLAKVTLGADENKHKCSSCTPYIVLFSIIFTINVGISTYFIYFHWYLKKDAIRVKFGTHTQTTIMDLQMGKVKQIEIKNRIYYFYNNIINIEELNSSLLKRDKKPYKDIDIYYIGYITIKKLDDYENIHSVNPLYLTIGKVEGHIEEKNKSKYLVFDSTNENKEALEKYTELSDGIKNEIETINGGEKGEYGKDFMKIKFNTDDNLPLNKPLKLHLLTIIVRCIFEEDSKFYPQLYLNNCLYEL